MANNEIGEIRRSMVIMNAAPGAVVDFRSNGAPISAVVAGLDSWDKHFSPAGMANDQVVYEDRLQKKLNVAGFRLPPVRLANEIKLRKREGKEPRALMAKRFPDWLQCPQCNRLGPSEKWGKDPGRSWRRCPKCSSESGQNVFVIPVRFVMACAKGHLNEFPWHMWVRHKDECSGRGDFLTLKAEGPGLAGLVLSCPKCGASQSLEGIFSVKTWVKFKISCRAKRPWLGDDDPQGCDLSPRVIQRGASNMYYPVMETALSIPPWSSRLPDEVGQFWASLTGVPDVNERIKLIELLKPAGLGDVLNSIGLTSEELAMQIEERKKRLDSSDSNNLRIDEHLQFTSGSAGPHIEDQHFEMRCECVPPTLAEYFDHVVRLVRLREVRALKGFTRIFPAGANGMNIAPLSKTPKQWLPAIEVKGEGIFISFDLVRIQAWEAQDEVKRRAEVIQTRFARQWAEYNEGRPADRTITARFLLIHTFAHILMRQLTMECGYSNTALRERLYVDQSKMAGFMIYTSTSDADGTLGGLQRQGVSTKMASTIEKAVKSIEWCSSDPLCIEGMMCGNESLSLAACHSCVLAPETSCEEFNYFLDRGMLIGLPDNTDLGFFSSLARSEYV